jgi:hypothetical protein
MTWSETDADTRSGARYVFPSSSVQHKIGKLFAACVRGEADGIDIGAGVAIATEATGEGKLLEGLGPETDSMMDLEQPGRES